MKTLHVIAAVAPRYGGPSTAVVGMCRALQSAGIDTLIATTDADGAGRMTVRSNDQTTFEQVPAMFFRRQASESFKWSMPLSNWLSKHVGDFDVVHVHGVFSHSSIAAGRACRDSGVPYVVRPLGQLDPWSVSRHAWRKKLLLALGGRQLLDGAAAMHYTTAEEGTLATEAVRNLPRGTIVPLGIDDELFVGAEELHSPRPPVLLTMSRLDDKKGIDVLISAFHLLAAVDQLASWRLVIAGEGSQAYVDNLKQLAAGGPARARITFAGWIDRRNRRRAFNDAGLFVLPSHQENFGIAVVEAMAAGLPAVVSPGVNLARDIADAGAGWVSQRTPDAVAATLCDAMSDTTELRRRAVAARRFAERFRWPAVGEALREMYESVARTSSACIVEARQRGGGANERHADSSV